MLIAEGLKWTVGGSARVAGCDKWHSCPYLIADYRARENPEVLKWKAVCRWSRNYAGSILSPAFFSRHPEKSEN